MQCSTILLESLEACFKEYYKQLYGYALKIVGDGDSAHDVVSEVFYSLWASRERIAVSDMKAYLYRCTRNEAITFLKQKKVKEEVTDRFYSENNWLEASPYETITCKQSIRLVNELLRSLSPERREIIELRLHGLSNNEIGEVLNIATSRVEYNMRESIEFLRKSVKLHAIDAVTLAEGFAVINIILMNF